MSHYFENDVNLKSNKRQLKLYINDKVLSFVSDSGVFSNTQIDYGSFTFLKTLLELENVNSILDVGCGYGVLGITLKYFGKCQNVTMVDINPKAVSLCQENINYYSLDNISCFISDGFNEVNSSYDQIVINPPIRAGKAVIYKMFEDSVKHLNENGSLYIVIKKNLGANSAITKLSELFKKVEVLKKDKGYFIIKATN